MQWKWNMECFSSPDFCLQLPECFVLGTSHANCCGCYIWLVLYMQNLCSWIYSLHNNSYCVCSNDSDYIHCSPKTNIKEHAALQGQEWRTSRTSKIAYALKVLMKSYPEPCCRNIPAWLNADLMSWLYVTVCQWQLWLKSLMSSTLTHSLSFHLVSS